jgi:hypothetical protein
MIEGGMQKLIDFTASKVVRYELPPNVNDFSDDYTVMNNHAIKMGLENVLDDVSEQLKGMSPNELLKVANFGISDIQRTPQLNESMVDIAIRNVIKEVMRKK